ncbi:MAG: fumarylacetoacetate hydrolase family protein [Alsobacter sp.]
MTHAVAVEPRHAIPVAGTDAVFPVRRVYCIGRNYAAHAREMGADPTREPPFFFNKAADCLLPVPPEGGVLPYPSQTTSYHHEIEMVVALKSGGTDIPEGEALGHVFGYAIGLDMTRRDLQDVAKKLARPWEVAKSADHSGPVGPIHPASVVGHPAKGFIRLEVNGTARQGSDLSAMIWSVPEQIAILSRYYELKAGDVIFSGTPEGVAAVERGDRLVGAIEGLGEIRLTVA